MKFARLSEDVLYREIAKDVYHVIERYRYLANGELFELSELDIYIMPMCLVKKALNSTGTENDMDIAAITSRPGKRRFGEDTELVLEALLSYGTKAQLACEKTATAAKKASDKFSKDGPRRKALEKAANKFGTSRYHYMLGLLDRDTVKPISSISAHIDINSDIESEDPDKATCKKDPLAYISGFSEGARLCAMPLMRKGFAEAYVAGFRKATELRVNQWIGLPAWITIKEGDTNGCNKIQVS